MKMTSKYLTVIAGLFIAVWSIIPMYWVFNLSFQTRFDIFTIPSFLFPPHATLINYLRAFGISKTAEAGSLGGLALVPNFIFGMQHSLIIATAVMIITLVLAIPCGYAFSRFSFRFKALLFFIILFSRSLPPISTVIPYYQFYKAVGLLGTYPGLIAVHLTLTVPLTVWVLSGFFGSLPVELDKQARMDGCTRLQMFRKILIPIAAPGLAAVGILAWLDSWNELIYALLLASVKDFYTVGPAIAAPLFGVGADIELVTAFTGTAIIPAILAAIILQRYMVRLRIADPLTFRTPG